MAREKGLSGGQKPFGFRFYEKLANGKNKSVNFISLDKGENDCPILILDEAPPGGDEWQPSVYIHERFGFNGSWNNYAVCRCKTPEGCLLDVALQEPHSHAPWCKVPQNEDSPGEGECDKLGKPQPRRGSWRFVATGLKLKPYTFEKGKNKGKTIPYQRGLILAPEDQYKTLLTYRKAWGGLRGRLFHASRGNGQFAARIGETWNPAPDEEVWTDEKMMEKFADAAANYGLSVEDYIRPMDYEKILKLPSVTEMAEIAKWVAGERGVTLTLPDGSSTAPNPVASAVGEDTPEGDSNDLPF
jgi:hypothetical protein